MTTVDQGRADQARVEQGLGALVTGKGNLPLESVEAAVHITGLVGRVLLTQGFQNPHDVPLEATYIFPLPDRAAVTAMRMTADGRVIEAELKERGQARQEYDQAIAEGKRASIAEEERPDVFTMRVGNILPGERVSVALTVVGPLSYEDGVATFRLPLVVARRYIPGTPIAGRPVGAGHHLDTDAVPDASRISPPVLLPGFPHPVRLSIEVDIDPAGLRMGPVTSSLHALTGEGNHLSITPGERLDRDFILRLPYGQPDDAVPSLTLTPDAKHSGDEDAVQNKDGVGTFRLTVLPPTTALPPRPRDVVLLLDRSGSMGGWKMVAARRAAARIVDTLTARDRFAVLTFDHAVEHPPTLPDALAEASDRNRFRAVEHLARVDARGGTELLAPLLKALDLLSRSETGAATDTAPDQDRLRVLVLVTDGQVGNEDQILATSAKTLRDTRVHTVGIDRAVNAGFLGRLAAAGGGRCELVESEDRLDDAMEAIHRRIGAPVATGLSLTTSDLSIVDGTAAPARLPDLYPGVPLVLTGRYHRQVEPVRGPTSGSAPEPVVVLSGQTRDGSAWSTRAAAVVAEDPALTATWARAHLRELEDHYVTAGGGELERRITATSLRFGVLCRFTAWLAVDTQVATDGTTLHRVIQPVEPVSGWAMEAERSAGGPVAPMMAAVSYAMPAAAMDSLRAAMAPPAGGQMLSGRGGRGRSAPIRAIKRDPREGRDELGLLRVQAAIEADRLRSAQAAPVFQRRELLSDLGTRLSALLRAAPLVASLQPARALLTELGADRPLSVPPAVFEQLWTRTLDVLDRLAGAAGAGSKTGTDPTGPSSTEPNPIGPKPTEPKPAGDRSTSFWKGRGSNE